MLNSGDDPSLDVRHELRWLVGRADLRLQGRHTRFEVADPRQHRSGLAEAHERVDGVA